MTSSSSLSVAANLPFETRKQFAIHALAGSEPVSRVAEREGVSRKFIYRQKHTAEAALDQAFSPPGESPDVLFNLQVTDAWLNQPILALVLVCHGSSRGVVRLLEGLSDTPISVATVHNRLAAAAGCAATINAAQDLSPVRVGLHDEIFQEGRPVLTGLDADSTHCYLLAEAEHRDGDTFHIQQQCEGLANRLAQGSATRRQRADIMRRNPFIVRPYEGYQTRLTSYSLNAVSELNSVISSTMA